MAVDGFSGRVLDYALSNHMLETNDKVVAGVSGGADSMCLLGLLIDWRDRIGLKIAVLHVNHGIRGAEAERDEVFVRDFCEKNNVPFYAEHYDVPRLAKSAGQTEEEMGRHLRYEAFLRLCETLDYNRIAVAHNQNDNAETVLFNIARGAGIAGVRGILPVRRLNGRFILIRPLLSSKRADIEKYLADKGIPHITDSTNLSDEYSRNYIRGSILSGMEERINAGAARHIAQLAGEALEIEELLDKLADRALEDVSLGGSKLDACKLAKYDPPVIRRVIRRLIGEAAGRLKDIERIHIDAVAGLIHKDGSKSLRLPYGIIAVKNYDILELRKVTKKCEARGKESTAAGVIPPKEQVSFTVTTERPPEDFHKFLYTKWFDYDKIEGDVEVRFRQPGDHLLLKMNGRLVKKDLSRFFIDSRIPKEERDSIPLLAAGSHILWVCGYRRDDSCLVSGDTVRYLKAECRQ